MIQFSYTKIQQALNKIAQMHLSDDNFVSVEFTDKEEIKVRYLDISKKSSLLPETISLLNEKGDEKIIKVSSEEGPKIVPLIGNVEKGDLPYISEVPLDGEMGGDQCANANDLNKWGTISFYAGGLQIDVSGRICNYHCGANSVLVSCNHVIARSDAASIGEVVWTRLRANTAQLACILPLGCEADLALAKFSDPSNIQLWTVRTIGKLNNVRNPVIGEAIKKYGARTRYSTGTIVGQAVVNTGSHVFHNVFKTSGAFACPGDSGSAIVASNNDLLGILSWGESLDCGLNPAAYFWIFDFQGIAKEECVLKISGLQS